MCTRAVIMAIYSGTKPGQEMFINCSSASNLNQLKRPYIQISAILANNFWPKRPGDMHRVTVYYDYLQIWGLKPMGRQACLLRHWLVLYF